MNWNDFQIHNLNEFKNNAESDNSQQEKNSGLLLNWIADNPILKTEIFEDNIEIAGQKYFRFYLKGIDINGELFGGFGRSKSRLRASSIASGELVERYVAKYVFKSSSVKAKNVILAKDGEISVEESNTEVNLPNKGFHSSNGWAVHFNLQHAIENSFLEALERHTLLYTYLKYSWDGFIQDQVVPFNTVNLTPYISKFSFGGFGAGIVTTTGSLFPGNTFGYICEMAKKLNSSEKWLSAFFESYDQWELFSQNKDQVSGKNILVDYQKHFLLNDIPKVRQNDLTIEKKSFDNVSANLVLIDIQRALKLPCPLFAAFSYGRDLIPLFFKQKISDKESEDLKQILKKWTIFESLPEFHPIL